jgi:hypothetical protein
MGIMKSKVYETVKFLWDPWKSLFIAWSVIIRKPVWLKIWLPRHFLLEFSYIEFQLNPYYGLWDTWKWEPVYLALFRLGFVKDRCGWKSELHHHLWWKFSMSNFKKICWTVWSLDRCHLHTRHSAVQHLKWKRNIESEMSFTWTNCGIVVHKKYTSRSGH